MKSISCSLCFVFLHRKCPIIREFEEVLIIWYTATFTATLMTSGALMLVNLSDKPVLIMDIVLLNIDSGG